MAEQDPIKQALRDFVTTSNSGKYKTEQELLSKFPELKGYETQVLRDFVTTANSGKYKTEDELFSKFPEFTVKKKEAGASPTPSQSRSQSVGIPSAPSQPVSGLEQQIAQTRSNIGVSQPTQQAAPVAPTRQAQVNLAGQMDSTRQSIGAPTQQQPTQKKPVFTYNDLESVLAEESKRRKAFESSRDNSVFLSRIGLTNDNLVNSTIAYENAKRKKDETLKNFNLEISRSVDNIIEGKSKQKLEDFFDEKGVFIDAKGQAWAGSIVAQYGGGSFVRDHLSALLKNKAVQKKNQDEYSGFTEESLKKRGINTQQLVAEYMKTKQAPIVDNFELFKTEKESEANRFLEDAQKKAADNTAKFQSFTEALNKKIESGQITREAAIELFNAEKNNYQKTLASIDQAYKNSVRDINVSLKRRFARIQDEVKKVTFDENEMMASLPKDVRQKYQEAMQEAKSNYFNFKNARAKAGDIAFDITGSVAGNVFRKSLASGFYGTLSNIGNSFLTDGTSNRFTRWLSSFAQDAERNRTAEYNWSNPVTKFAQITGQTLGGSALQMVPTIALSAVGAGPVATTLLGGITSAGIESQVQKGQQFEQSLAQGKTIDQAREDADKAFSENMKNLPFYFVGSLGSFKILQGTGARGFAKGLLLENVEEIPLSYRQEFTAAKLENPNLTMSQFIADNPHIALETAVGTLGMSGAMSVGGKAFSALQRNVPSPAIQSINQIVQMSGAETALSVAEKYFELGVIDKTTLDKVKLDIPKIAESNQKMTTLGVDQDRSVLLSALSDKHSSIKKQVETEQDPAVKSLLQTQLSDVESDIKGVTSGSSPYMKFTYPGGTNLSSYMTAREFNALSQQDQDEMIKAADKINVVGDDAVNTQINERKKNLGNAFDIEGAYTNGLTPEKVEASEDVEAKKADIERRRQEEIASYDKDALNEIYSVGSDQTIEQFINAKYDAELSALEQTSSATELSKIERTPEQIKAEIKQKFPFIQDEDFVQEAFTPDEDVEYRDSMPAAEFASREEFEQFLKDGEYAMLTGQNPDSTPLSKTANAQLNERATQWLDERGLKAIPIFGKYGGSERSFMVPGMSKQQAIEFANEFQQDSVAHSSGLVKRDGSFNPRTGEDSTGQFFENNDDNYSTINIAGEKVDFKVGYDFKTLVGAQQVETQQQTEVQPTQETVQQKDVDTLSRELLEDLGIANIDNDIDRLINSALSFLSPTGIRIRVVDDIDEFDAQAAKVNQDGSQGYFLADDGEIVLSRPRLRSAASVGAIIWHETAHPVMNIIRNTNKELYDRAVAGAKKIAPQAHEWAKGAESSDAAIDDETLVEAISMVANGTINIDDVPKGVLKSLMDFVNKIAELLKLRTVQDDKDIAAFRKLAGDIAQAMKEGRGLEGIVGEENVTRFEDNIEDDPGVVISGQFKAQGRYGDGINLYAPKSVDSPPIRTLADLFNRFLGRAVVINSDPTRVGELKLPSGKTIFMYGGPSYLSISENVRANVGFATTQIGKVKSWQKYVNALFGNETGLTLVATQAPTSILSNSYALRYVLDAISMLPKSVLKSSDFKNEFFGKDLVLLKKAFGDKAYNDFVKKYRSADLSNPDVIEEMISEMGYKIGDDNRPASFKARGQFVANLLGGIAAKSSLKTVEGNVGYTSKKPNKFIAKQLMDRLGVNAEKVIREIGEPSIVDAFFNDGKWGFAVSGFETDPNISIESVQSGGITHPLFNAKFPGKNPFFLDGAYQVDEMFAPVEMIGPKGEPYTKKASQMLAGSMYVMGEESKTQDKSFDFKETKPTRRRAQGRRGDFAPKKGVNLVEKAGWDRRMTEDDKGNYLFFHFSNKDLTKSGIDPSKHGASRQTSRQEAMQKPNVSYYYTTPSKESFTGDFGHVVAIPKHKVYPFQKDPLNLYDEAREAFLKDYPFGGFGPNQQIGWISKIAAKYGFDMVVGEWNGGMLRAETTVKHKPEFYSKPGLGINTTVFNPKYENVVPNRKKKRGQGRAGDQESTQGSKGSRDSRLSAFIKRNREEGVSDAIIRQSIRKSIEISDAELDSLMTTPAPQAPTGMELEEANLDLEGEGVRKTRAMAKNMANLPTETLQEIDEDAKKYFRQTNRQTEKAVEDFLRGKDIEDMADYVVSDPQISDTSLVWMAASVAKKLKPMIQNASNPDLKRRLAEKQAAIYETFAKKATGLGQAVQAFVAFKNDTAAVQFYFNKILTRLKGRGVERVTKNQEAKIKDLLTRVSEAKDGMPKDEAIIELYSYLNTISPVSPMEALEAIWYAKILSGVTTQAKNFWANAANILIEIPILSTYYSIKNLSLAPFMYGFKGAASGAVKGAVIGADIIKTGLKRQESDKYFKNNVLEHFTWGRTKIGKLGGGVVGKILDNPLLFEFSPKALRYIGRTLSAVDAVFSNSSKEAYSNIIAWQQAVKEGKEKPAKNNFKRVNEILGNTKESVIKARNEAISEGLKPGTVRFKRRVFELIDQGRIPEITERAEEFGSRNTLTNPPEGFSKPMYDAIVWLTGRIPVLKAWVPFSGIVSNLTEQMFNYSPAGLYRAVTGVRNPFDLKDKGQLTDEERGILYIKAVSSMAAFAFLASIVGDEEDDWFDVTANGTGNIQKNYELAKDGWEAYTITYKDSDGIRRNISYKDWPIRGILSGLGAIRDEQKFGEPKEGISDKVGLYIYGMLLSMYESSVMKGFADFIDIFAPEKRGKYESIGDGVEKWTAQQGKSVLMSNFTQQALKFIDQQQGDPLREAKGFALLWRDIPVFNDGMRPIIDVFGDPVVPNVTQRLFPAYSVPDEKKDSVLEFLHERGLFVSVPKRVDVIDLETGDKTPMDDDQYWNYRKTYGETVKKLLYEFYDDYKGEDKEVVSAYLTKIKEAATKAAKYQLYTGEKIEF